MFSANSMGPKMEPLGTPQVMGAAEEKRFPVLMEQDLSVR